MKVMVPITLKNKWIKAARFAFVDVPILLIMAVTQVPIFAPIMIGMAAPKEMAPVIAKACKIPMVAEELWIRAVKTAPTKRPSRGFENATSNWRKPGNSESGITASLMICMPNIMMAKPIRIRLIFFFRSLSDAIMTATEANAIIGAKKLGLNSWNKVVEAPIDPRLKIQAVAVVPMLAPMMRPTV